MDGIVYWQVRPVSNRGMSRRPSGVGYSGRPFWLVAHPCDVWRQTLQAGRCISGRASLFAAAASHSPSFDQRRRVPP
jgi:hypothetical protein